MMAEFDAEGFVVDAVSAWLARRGSARNTIASGLVVLSKLADECPLNESEVFTPNGEMIGARGTALKRVFAQWDVPANYLKEVTTRQAAEYARDLLRALVWGQSLAHVPIANRLRALEAGAAILLAHVEHWLTRQKLRVPLDSQSTPGKWVTDLLDRAENRSTGIVEQHIVGAKLERRFPGSEVENHPAHAADRQTGRDGDFVVGRTVYHVTANPTPAVVEKCTANIRAGKHPVLLVPRIKVSNAEAFAEYQLVRDLITIAALEDFVALNVIEIAIAEDKERIDVMREILDAYNRRLQEVETDLSLMVEID